MFLCVIRTRKNHKTTMHLSYYFEITLLKSILYSILKTNFKLFSRSIFRKPKISFDGGDGKCIFLECHLYSNFEQSMELVALVVFSV
jgi:hypothetical protein